MIKQRKPAGFCAKLFLPYKHLVATAEKKNNNNNNKNMSKVIIVSQYLCQKIVF
jgi:hypothetical protein